MSGGWIDPWLVRHLLLSVPDTDRLPRDRAETQRAVDRTIEALASLAPPEPFRAPADTLACPGELLGVPGWVFETNSWVLAPAGVRGSCLVFDVPPQPSALIDALVELELSPSAVFLTHAHFDHVGGVSELLEAIGSPVPVYVHHADLEQVVQPLGADRLLARSLSWGPPARAALHPLQDGAEVVVAGVVVRAVHAPGHTPGTLCYVVDGLWRRLIVSGDQLFAGGIGRSDLPGGDYAGMLASLEILLSHCDDDTVILPGHGEATTVASARVSNPFLAAAAEVAAPTAPAPAGESVRLRRRHRGGPGRH
jgi:glyoxylase-like metal-dependent hydrolase (beta-lactamase superfamily II)